MKRVLWLCVLAALVLGAALIARQRAQAASGELLRAGSWLAHAHGLSLEPPQLLHVNGAPLFVQSAWTREAPRQALRRYAERCSARPLFAGLPALLELGAHNDAVVACLEPAVESATLAELLERLERVFERGDLAPLGELRFVWASRGMRGTRFVSVWSGGGLPFAAMFPAQGDAPGGDLPELPRPAHTTRNLSIGLAPQSPAIASYASAAPLHEAGVRYEQQLRAAGFDVGRVPEPDAETIVWQLSRGARSALAFIQPDANGTLITLVALDATALADAR